jgi:uncharacterized protein (TIGR03000 family)
MLPKRSLLSAALAAAVVWLALAEAVHAQQRQYATTNQRPRVHVNITMGGYDGPGYFPGAFRGYGPVYRPGYGIPVLFPTFSYGQPIPTIGVIPTPAPQPFFPPAYPPPAPVVIIPPAPDRTERAAQPTPPAAEKPNSFKPNPARLQVLVPTPDAKVLVEGAEMAGEGTNRIFSFADVKGNSPVTYTVTASWTQNGQTVMQEKRVQVTAGITSIVVFTAPVEARPVERGPENLPRPKPVP